MATSQYDLFTREEALAGLPARRAQTALFLIESRTARWVGQARQVMEPFLSETTAADRDMAFVEAFARGGAPPVRPTIQDLEQYAAAWRGLAPENPRVRAALAHLLGQKYKFGRAGIPGIRAALGLDEPAVQAAYERLYGGAIETIYTPRLTFAERLRWAWARLGRAIDNLPPFWAIFVLTFTQTVGATVLALPIALAGVGPIPGIALLAVFGLVNILTIAAQAEAAARSGEMRYGTAFLGRMVETYLGRTGAGIVAVAIAADCIVTLLAFYSGFGSSLADATGLPAGLWSAVLFLVILYFLRRESLSATITSSLVIGAFNLCLLAVITAFAFAHLDPENLRYVQLPLLSGQPFNPVILQVIFGVVLGAYFGHLSVGNYARLALTRDASARSLIWGAGAALAAAILVYSVWVVAVNGAVPPEVMAEETGTALGPLATVAGPVVNVLGAIYVVLAIAIVSVHFSLSLYNLVRERLPRHAEPVVWLSRRQGRLILRPRSSHRSNVLSLTYLGLAPGAAGRQARFRVDVQQPAQAPQAEIVQLDCWDDVVLRRRWPGLDPRVRLSVTVETATQEGVRLQVATPMALRYEGEWDAAGLRASDLLELPDQTRNLLTWLMRCGEATPVEAAAHMGVDEAFARLMLTQLAQQGVLVEVAPPPTAPVDENGGPRYRPQLGRRRGSSLPGDLLDSLDRDRSDNQAGAGRSKGSRVAKVESGLFARLGPQARFWLAASPIAIVFLVTEVLLWTGSASFVGILGFLGTVIDSCLAGLFPVLLLYASRRKGEFVPGRVYRLLGRPWLLAGIYLLFIGGILLHGLVIWQNPIQRISAVSVSLFMLAATAVLIRKGAFAGRVVVEICEDLTPGSGAARSETGAGRFAITARGRPVGAEVRAGYATSEAKHRAASGVLPDFGALRQLNFDLPASVARDLKVWAHRVTAEGLSEPLSVVAEVYCGDAVHAADLRLSGGQVLLPWMGPACQLTVRFDRAADTGQSPEPPAPL